MTEPENAGTIGGPMPNKNKSVPAPAQVQGSPAMTGKKGTKDESPLPLNLPLVQITRGRPTKF
jgi:hypothetical protein